MNIPGNGVHIQILKGSVILTWLRTTDLDSLFSWTTRVKNSLYFQRVLICVHINQRIYFYVCWDLHVPQRSTPAPAAAALPPCEFPTQFRRKPRSGTEIPHARLLINEGTPSCRQTNFLLFDNKRSSITNVILRKQAWVNGCLFCCLIIPCWRTGWCKDAGL